MSELNQIEKQWRAFAEDLPPGTSEQQLDIMKQSFFSGAQAILLAMSDIGPQDDLEVIARLEDIRTELIEFQSEMIETAEYPEPTCIHCGCTENNACLDIIAGGNCYWVALDQQTNAGVCSMCSEKERSAL